MNAPSKYRLLIRLLALTGFILALVSLYHYVQLHLGLSGSSSFCNINASFDCDQVNRSRWASFFGIPLASFGGAFYIVVFMLSFQSNRLLSYWLQFALALVASLMSLALFIISEVEIGTLCIMCLGMYLINFALLFTVLYFGRKTPEAEGTAATFSSVAFNLLFIGLLSLAWLFNSKQITAAIVLKGSNEFITAWQRQPQVEFSFSDNSVLDRDYSKGPQDAPVTLVEFSDMECSACRNFYFVAEQLFKDYEGKLRIVFKNFPLDNACNPLLKAPMHINACYAALFARCAGEQGRYWESLDYIFNLKYAGHAPDGNFLRRELEKSFSILKLDEIAMRECLKSDRQLNKIRSDIREGQAIGVTATPSIWINGRKLQYTGEASLREILNELTR